MRNHILFVALLAIVPLAQADLTFHSGNGADDMPDSLITYRAIPQDAMFTAGDLGLTTDHATVISHYGDWKERLDGDTSAEWISTRDDTSSDSAIFSLSVGPVSAGPQYLHFAYLVDNYLGTSHDNGFGGNDGFAGIYVNGTALSGSRDPIGGFNSDLYFNSGDISSLLSTSGTNIIQVVLGNDSSQGGSPAGLIFSGSINNSAQAVPEPGTLAALGLGALTMLRRRARKG